jgi:hypothetical protein
MTAPADRPGARQRLRAGPDGRFTILQLTDLHEGAEGDARTAAFLSAVLDDQRPDLVVLTGDLVAGDLATEAALRRALGHVVGPAEARRIPWVATLGNHDEDHTPATGVDAAGLLALCQAYPHNLNGAGAAGPGGAGDALLLVEGSGGGPAFAIWALDTGREAPAALGGQRLADGVLPGWGWLPRWSWLRHDQVAWYAAGSAQLERTHGRKVPSLVFLHVPLHEHRLMWEGDAARRAAGLPPLHGVTGERNEEECVGAFNAGLFAAALGRGDVLGVFAGHDHVNDYAGDCFGITLAYAASAGFAPYGLGGEADHRLRGARLVRLDERDPWRLETRMLRASAYGVG